MATVTCPACGADFLVDDPSLKFAVCPFCGTKVAIAVPKTETRASSRRAAEEPSYTQKLVKSLKKRFFKFCRTQPKKAVISFAVCIALVAVGVSACSKNAAKKQAELQHQATLAQLERERIGYSHLADGEVQMPEIDIGTATDYRIVQRDFEDAGFTNITTEPVADLTNTTTARYNAVIEVTVDGVPELKAGSWYSMDVPIVITYHTVGDTILTPSEQAWSIAQGLLHGHDGTSASEDSSHSDQDEEAAWSTAHQVMTGAIGAINEFGANIERFTDHVTEQTGPSEYDYAFSRIRLICQEYYLLDLDNSLVYCIIEPDDPDDITTATVGHIASGDLQSGLTVQYNYDGSSWTESLVLDGDDLLVTDSLNLVHRYSPEKVYVGEAMLDKAVVDQGD